MKLLAVLGAAVLLYFGAAPAVRADTVTLQPVVSQGPDGKWTTTTSTLSQDKNQQTVTLQPIAFQGADGKWTTTTSTVMPASKSDPVQANRWGKNDGGWALGVVAGTLFGAIAGSGAALRFPVRKVPRTPDQAGWAEEMVLVQRLHR